MSIAKIRSIVESTETPAGKIFDAVVQVLIVASMIAFAVETLPDLAPATRRWLRLVERAVLAFFVIEYLLRLFVAEKPWRYATSFFGIIDLLAIAPMAIGLFDARAVRTLRLLRLLRLLKLARYSEAVRRLHLALKIAWEELVLFSVVSGILLFIAAAGVYQFENAAQPEAFASVFHALWWAIVTLTTVGYGDVYPVTTGGRVFTFLVLIVGLGFVAAPTAMIASALTQARQIEDQREAHTSD